MNKLIEELSNPPFLDLNILPIIIVFLGAILGPFYPGVYASTIYASAIVGAVVLWEKKQKSDAYTKLSRLHAKIELGEKIDIEKYLSSVIGDRDFRLIGKENYAAIVSYISSRQK